MSCNILKFKNSEITGTTFEGRTLTINGATPTTAKVVVRRKYKQELIQEVQGVVSASTVSFSFKELEALPVGSYGIEYWVEIEDIGLEVVAVEELNIINAINSDCVMPLVSEVSGNIVFQKQELVVNLIKNIIQNGTPPTSPAVSPAIFIRQATPMYLEMGEHNMIYLIISVESEVPFSIKSIKLIREEQQDYDVPFDGFIEEILPLKQKEEDIKGNKTVAFGASKENNYDFFYSIIESYGVEVTVTMGDTEKVLFSFMSLSEKYFGAKIMRGMERNT